MNAPKLVVLDLDGTVVRHSTKPTTPSREVVKALAAVTAAGAPVAIATGRAPWGALRTAADLGLVDGLVSASHGAVTFDLGTSKITESHVFDPSVAVAAFTRANAATAFAVEVQNGWRHTANFNRDFHSEWADIVDVATLSATQTARLAARLPGGARYGAGARCPVASDLALQAALDPEMYCVEVGFNGWIDVGPPGITKATGVAAIAGHYGVTAEETIVFGDAANDLPMFAWAGHAVAMGQAVPEIQAAADEIAPSVEHDGVARVLRRWFP